MSYRDFSCGAARGDRREGRRRLQRGRGHRLSVHHGPGERRESRHHRLGSHRQGRPQRLGRLRPGFHAEAGDPVHRRRRPGADPAHFLAGRQGPGLRTRRRPRRQLARRRQSGPGSRRRDRATQGDDLAGRSDRREARRPDRRGRRAGGLRAGRARLCPRQCGVDRQAGRHGRAAAPFRPWPRHRARLVSGRREAGLRIGARRRPRLHRGLFRSGPAAGMACAVHQHRPRAGLVAGRRPDRLHAAGRSRRGAAAPAGPQPASLVDLDGRCRHRRRAQGLAKRQGPAWLLPRRRRAGEPGLGPGP